MRCDHVIVQNVRHLRNVLRKPDGGKSCQGRAIKANARESYDSIPVADHLWRMGRRDQNTVILRRMLTSTDAEVIWRPLSKKICFRGSLSNSNGISIS